MDTYTLQYIIDTDYPTLHGMVCARDQLLSIKGRRKFYIVNTDPISKPGQHWILIYRTTELNCYYFDSYGGYNPIENDISNFLSINGLRIYRNRNRFQSDSTELCGVYCLYVLHALLHLDHTFSRIVLNTFCSTDWLSNDLFLVKWFRKYYTSLVNKIRTTGKNITCQTCVSRR